MASQLELSGRWDTWGGGGGFGSPVGCFVVWVGGGGGGSSEESPGFLIAEGVWSSRALISSHRESAEPPWRWR